MTNEEAGHTLEFPRDGQALLDIRQSLVVPGTAASDGH